MPGIFGKNLKFLRKVKGWNQEELANNLGIKRSSIAAYESKEVEPRLKVIFKMADLLGVEFEKMVRELLTTPAQLLENNGKEETYGEKIDLFSFNSANAQTIDWFEENIHKYRKITNGNASLQTIKEERKEGSTEAFVLAMGEVSNILFLMNKLLETDEELLRALKEKIR